MDQRVPIPRRTWLAALSAASLARCAPASPSAFARLRDAQRSADALALALSEAEGALRRAVLASDADGARSASEHAASSLEQITALCDALREQLGALEGASELDLLERFRTALQAYQAAAQGLQTLAVQKSNERALAIAFGPLLREADEAAEALRALPLSRCELRLDALGAALALREREALLPVHIAEADGARMDALEQRLTAAAARGREALAALAQGAALPAGIGAGWARFDALEREALTLSRQNSDVRSRALALGELETRGHAASLALSALRSALDARSAPARR